MLVGNRLDAVVFLDPSVDDGCQFPSQILKVNFMMMAVMIVLMMILMMINVCVISELPEEFISLSGGEDNQKGDEDLHL